MNQFDPLVQCQGSLCCVVRFKFEVALGFSIREIWVNRAMAPPDLQVPLPASLNLNAGLDKNIQGWNNTSAKEILAADLNPGTMQIHTTKRIVWFVCSHNWGPPLGGCGPTIVPSIWVCIQYSPQYLLLKLMFEIRKVVHFILITLWQ